MTRFLLVLFALACGIAVADTKISALPAGTTLTGTEAIPMVQTGQCAATGGTCQTTPAAITTYVNGAASLDASRTTSGTFSQTRILTCAANQIVFDNASAALTCAGTFTWTNTTSNLSLGSVALPPTVTTPAGSTSNGTPLTFTTGAGNGTSKNGGLLTFTTGAGTSTIGNGGQIHFSTGANGSSVAVDQPNQIQFHTPFSDLAFGGNDLTWTSGSTSGTQLFFGDTAAGAGAGLGIYTLNHEFDVAMNDTAGGTFNVSNGPSSPYGFVGDSLGDTALWTLLSTKATAALAIDPSQNILSSVKSNATTDTNGFFYTGSAAGVPTGVPANLTGYYANSVPTRYDTTNNQACYYNGSWRCAPAVPFTAPTISSGFGSGASISNNVGPRSFSVNIGTGGTATAGVVGLPAAAHAWACSAADTGATPTGRTEPTAGTTTSVTLTNFGRTTGVAVAWTASEVVQVSCWAN